MNHGGIDVAAMREAVKGPGVDTRMWLAMGTVVAGTADKHPVRFTDEDGNALPHGVLVDVKLHPSGTEVPCRVMGRTAGNGTGEYHPFVDGDEVLVAVPGGDERSGCVIMGRANQALDVFPTTVAGMDVTQNTVGFLRCVEPYVIESATAVVLRQATTGAALSIDPTGQVFLSSGDGAILAMSHDASSFQLKDATAAFQLDPSKVQASVVAGGSAFVVDDQASEFQTAGFLSVSTGGNGAAEHVTTAEAVLGFLNVFLQAAATAATAPPALVAFFATFASPGPLAALVATASSLPLDPTVAAALVAAFSVPKVSGLPNLGCPGFLAS